VSKRNVDIVRSAIEANSLLSVFDDNAEMIAPTWGLDTGVFRGTDAIRAWLRNWIGSWEGYEAQTFECIDAEPHVLVEQVLRGRSKQTGLSLDARHWNVFALTDGKVVRWRFYRTRAEALAAVGLSGQEARGNSS
jgi:ketosteroid isomerase-like protein